MADSAIGADAAAAGAPVTSDLDPFTLEIIKDKLAAIADEMGAVLARASMSPIVYEVLDFACGVADARGQVVAQTNGLTLFTGTFRPQIVSVLEKYGDDLHPGDVFMTNDPYRGGTHICDVCLAAPIFAGDALVGFGVSITHWIEIGGAVPGSIPPDATEIYQEGVLIPCVRIASGERLQPEIVDLIAANVRLPKIALGDLRAGTAAVRIAERGVVEIAERYGTAALDAAYASLFDHGEAQARRALELVPDGVYEATDVIDGDGVSDAPLDVRVSITVRGDTMEVDFTGTSATSQGPVNCSRGALESACKTVFRAITDPQARSNEGCFRPFTIVCPPGTIFTAQSPTPTGWYYEATAFATELVWKALASAVPERLGAGSYVSLCVSYVVGHDAEGEVFVLAEPNDGGWGADTDGDGASGLIATVDGDTYNFPVEVIESRFPLRVERYSFDADAGGGAGRHRGGLGVVREYRVLNERGAIGYGSMGGWRRRPWGLDGGGEGTNNFLEYVRGGEARRHGRINRIELEHGDVIRVVTGSGGGYGSPLAREPELVLADVQDGYLTVDQARDVYGVVIDASTATVDGEATARLREGGTVPR
ncbi:MAG: N-methylhydantoinase [Solirubrobacteraceae bacterium]|nr:N-methylhydantoinase [Solirubrobacteraceae bacterium]